MVAQLRHRPRRSAVRPGMTKQDGPSWRAVRSKMIVPAFKKLRSIGVHASVEHLQPCRFSAAQALSEKADEWVGFNQQHVPVDADEQFCGLYLQHCLAEESKPAVRAVLAKEGLTVDWDGSNERTIFVDLHNKSGLAWAWLRKRMKYRFLTQYWLEQTAHLHAPEAREGERALAAFRSGAWNEVEPGDHEPGLTAAWGRVGFRREVVFGILRMQRFMERCNSGTLFKTTKESPNAMTKQHDESSFLSQTELYLNGALPKRVTCSEVQDATTNRGLKGAELDAVAFRGPVLKLASYSCTAQAFAIHLTNPYEGIKDAFVHYVPRNGETMSIAELHRTIEKHQLWIVRCEQRAHKYDMDRVHFEGLEPTAVDGGYDAKWSTGAA